MLRHQSAWLSRRHRVRISLAEPKTGAAQRRRSDRSRPDAARAASDHRRRPRAGVDSTPAALRHLIASLAIAWFAANAFFTQWDTWLRFRYGGAFGVSDPLHGIDVGLYVFQLPFYQMLQTSVMLLTALTIGGVGIVYAYSQAVSLRRGNRSGPNGRATSHLSVLLLIFYAVLRRAPDKPWSKPALASG